MNKSITDLQNEFQTVHAESLAVGKQLAESIDMLSIGDVRETIAKSIVEMESMVNRKSSLLEKLPWAGRYLAKARDAAKAENMQQNGSMVKTVDRLFKTLTKKNESVMDVMERLYGIRQHLTQYVSILREQESQVLAFLEKEGDTFEAQKAKNLLVQIKPSIVKSIDRLEIMSGTLNSAQVASQAISGMLPSLQGELQTELAIKASMTELKEFKDLFENTLDLIEDLNYQNNKDVQETVLEVNQLAIQNPRNLKRLEAAQKERRMLHLELAKRNEEARENQAIALERLTNIQADQQKTLGYKH